jgi:nucleoside-diphosphate-sugar epimerase
MGRFANPHIYADDDLSAYHALPPTAWHKGVDDIVFEAGDRGMIDAIIICPPLIWGTGQGVFNQRSLQILGMIKAFLAAGKAYTVGSGANVWTKVHITDISRVFLTVLKAALAGNIPSNPRDRYYFGEADDFVIADVTKVVAEELVKKGALPTAEVVSVQGGLENEEVKGILITGLASNARSKAVKARKLGWKPNHVGNEEFFDDARELVDYALKSRNR